MIVEVTEKDTKLEREVPDRMRELTERLLRETTGWREEHPKATFRQIESEVEERLGAIRQGLIEELAQTSVSSDLAKQAESKRPRCGECEGSLEVRGQQDREVMILRGGRVQLQRSYAVCGACGAGVFPPR